MNGQPVGYASRKREKTGVKYIDLIRPLNEQADYDQGRCNKIAENTYIDGRPLRALSMRFVDTGAS